MAYEKQTLSIINFNLKQIHDKESFDFVLNDLLKISRSLRERKDPMHEAFEYAYWHIYFEFPEYQEYAE